MHAPIHLVIATESDRIRRADAEQARARSSVRRRRLRGVVTRVRAAHGIPPRAAPGTDSLSLGRPTAAPSRGR